MAWRPSFRKSITSIPLDSLRASTSTNVCRACRLRMASRSSSRAYATSAGGSQIYNPATTWEGLEWVGTPELVKKHKTPYISFKPFIPPKIPEDQVMDEFLKALIEVFQYKKQKVLFDGLDDVPSDFKWPSGIEIKYEQGSNEPVVTYLNKTAENSLLESLGLKETEVSPPEDHIEPLTEDIPVVTTTDLTWKDIPLDDMNLRFALIKRTMRRTGRRIPDSKIVEATTAFALYSELWLEIKEKKLAQTIGEEGLLNLPNVRVSPRKLSGMDKDITEGRWKVIRRELAQRNLPEFDPQNWENEYKIRKGESST